MGDRRRDALLKIGLAIGSAVVEAHGGQVRFETTPGKGTTFTFSLPG